MDLKTKIRTELEKAHCAALKTGGTVDSAAADIIAAGCIFKHVTGADFSKSIQWQRNNDNAVTGGMLYINGIKICIGGSSKKTITRELAFHVHKLLPYFIGEELVANG